MNQDEALVQDEVLGTAQDEVLKLIALNLRFHIEFFQVFILTSSFSRWILGYCGLARTNSGSIVVLAPVPVREVVVVVLVLLLEVSMVGLVVVVVARWSLLVSCTPTAFSRRQVETSTRKAKISYWFRISS